VNLITYINYSRDSSFLTYRESHRESHKETGLHVLYKNIMITLSYKNLYIDMDIFCTCFQYIY